MEWKRKWAGPGAAVLFVCLLGFWHFFDVRAGAVGSGDLWLLNLYGFLFGGLLAALFFAGVILLGRKLRPEFAAFFLVLFFGTAFLFVLPPLSAPDEIAHFASAYAVSNRMLGKKAVDEKGNVFVRNEDLILTDLYGAEGEEERVSLGRTLTEETWRTIVSRLHPLFPDAYGRQMTPTVIGTVKTTPAAYVFPALGITAVRILGLNCMILAFLGRFMNLLLFAAAVFVSVRILPMGKRLLSGVSLLPMTLHLAASFSYDAFILSGSFFFASYCLYLAYGKPQVTKKDVAILCTAIAFLGPCKMVYGIFLGFALLIPVKKFGGWGKWLLSACLTSLVFVAAMLLVNRTVIASYAAGADAYVSWAAEESYSIPYVIHNPVRFLRILYETVLRKGDEWFLTMLGSKMGNLDPVLSVPFVVLFGHGICLVLLGTRSTGEALFMTQGQKLWTAALGCGLLAALMAAMLVGWTPLSSPVVEGVQGRYLLPILPFILMLLKTDRVVRTDGDDDKLLFYMCALNGYALLRLFSIVSMRL